MIRTIAITGPESTGKSILAAGLARHYKTVWVPEFAREYLESLGRTYREDDIFQIARGQLESEKSLRPAARDFLFCDTELLVIKIWSMVKYGRCHPWILKKLENHGYDLYLLCDIDLPWQYDPLREHPESRQFLFDFYTRELNAAGLPYAVVSGSGPGRLINAVKIIDNYNF